MALNIHYRRQRENELRGINLRELLKITDWAREDFCDWLRKMALLHYPLCPKCSSSMSFKERDDGFVCHRRACRSGASGGTRPYVPAKHKSFFQRSNLPASKIVEMSYFWTAGMGRIINKEHELNVSHTTLVRWEQYFRDICCKYYKKNRPLLGGPGAVVEIDETCVTRRKYNRGRVIRKHQWLFGGIERGSCRSFLLLVKKRDARTLLRLITKYIQPGTTIVSDCWRAYTRLPTLPQAYIHLTVNHSINFVCPRTGANTQTIECHWQKFKMMAKTKYGINNKRYRDYISEFLWRKQFGNVNDVFFHFWDQVASIYTP